MNKLSKLLIGINRPGTTSVLYGWGRNTSGQIGDGTTTTVQQISLIDSQNSWVQLATGQVHTVGIKSDGSLWNWGSQQAGVLGDGVGGLGSVLRPQRIGSSLWRSVASGSYHTLAIRSDYTLWSWGFGTSGQLGDGGTISRSSPVQVGTSSWTQVSCGKDTSAAIRSDGTLWMWGNGSSGGLGQLNDLSIRNSPVQIGATPILGTATATVTTITPTLLGTAALTATTSNTGDDSFLTLSIPWNISFLGLSYNTIYVGTNMYITFGAGSSVYSGLSAINPALPKIMLFAADRSAQRYYYGVEGVAPNRTYRIKFEGSTSTSGTLGSPTMGYEAVFYESTPARIDIHMTHLSSTGGVLGIYSASTLIQAITTTQLSLTSSISVTTGVSSSGVTDAYSWTQVSVGELHTAAIRQDGTLWTWGSNTYGQLGQNNSTFTHRSSPVQVGTGSWTQIRATRGATLAIDTTSKLWGWGEAGQHGGLSTANRSSPVQVGSDSWVAIGGGPLHALAIRSDETLWGWGDNATYQLTLNETIYSWTQIQTGANSTAAIRSDGTLWTWGRGLLGDGITYQQKQSPGQVGTSSWNQVSVGQSHMVAIRSDGKLFAWGDNPRGQLGDGTVVSKLAPLQIGTDNWIHVSAGNEYTTAVRSDGALFAWGFNAVGQLADGTTVSKSSPVQIGTSSWTQVDAGWYHVNAIKSDGTLWGWGDNLFGQIGKHDDPTPASNYTYFAGPQTSSDVDPFFAIKNDGTLWTWGGSANNLVALMYGRGETTFVQRSSPVQVGTSSWTQVISRGGNGTNSRVFGINNTGQLYAWGTGTLLGFPGTVTYSTPTLVTSGSWAQVSTGQSHTIALKTDGTLWGWGDNSQWQLDGSLYAPVNSYTQVVGTATRLAIRSDGTLWGWGYNTPVGLISPTTGNRSSPVQVSSNTDWTWVAMGSSSAAAINSTGGLYTWGSQTYGQLGNNSNSSLNVTTLTLRGTGYAKVFAGRHIGMHAIKQDGTLWGWGVNSYKQIGDGTSFDRSSPVQIGSANTWTSISKGATSTYGIRSDGSLWGWGYDIPIYIPPLTFTSLATSFNYQVISKFGITNTGALIVQGRNESGQLGTGNTADVSNLTQLGTSSWTAVSSGGYHTLGVRVDGTLWGWGQNYNGQLGDSTFINKSSPVQVGTDTNWVKISAGPDRSFAIKTNGTLYNWGASGYLSPTISSNYAPVQITGSWAQVSAGLSHALAINDQGKLFAWGSGTNGKVGILYNHPISWTQISSSYGHSLAIAGDGSLWAWGANEAGQLGTVNTVSRIAYPIKIGNNSWTQVAATTGRSLAIRADGTLWIWGNFYNTGDLTTPRSSPVQIGTDTNWSKIAMGSSAAHLIKSNGTLWAIGQWANRGDGSSGGNETWLTPTQIGTGTWNQVSTAATHSLGIRSDNTLWAWGYNNTYGQMGTGSTNSSLSMVQVGSGTWSIVRAGSDHSAGIRTDNILFTWGRNDYGELGIGSSGVAAYRSSPVQIGTAGLYTDISVGYVGTIAIAANGQAVGTGWVNMSTPNTASTFTLMNGGNKTWIKLDQNSPRQWTRQHFIAFDGSLFYSGTSATGFGGGAGLNFGGATISTFDSFPPVEVPTQIGNSNWTSVYAGNNNSFAIRSDGALFGWGLNTDGILGDGTAADRSSPVQIGTSSWTAVAAATKQTFAITTDGRVFSWGYANNDNSFAVGASNTSLGDATFVSRSSPVQVDSGATGGMSGIAAGTFQNGDRRDAGVLILKSGADTNLYGWGELGYLPVSGSQLPVKLMGQLSVPASSFPGRDPAIVIPGSWTSVSTGEPHTVAIKSDGTLWTWGTNQYGQLGLGTANSAWNAPAQVGTSSWTAVAGGWYATHAIKADGKLFAWGFNVNSQLGDGTVVDRSSPVQIGTSSWLYLPTPDGEYGIGVGAIRSDYLFAGWGSNFYGSIGDGTSADRSTPTVHSSGPLTFLSTPTQLGTANNWVEIATGSNHTIARTSSNAVFGWGNNSFYQAGNNASTPLTLITRVITTMGQPIFARSITASNTSSYALRDEDGGLYVWGTGPGGVGTYSVANIFLNSNGSFDTWSSYKVGQDVVGAIGISTGGTVYTGSAYANTPLTGYSGTATKVFLVGSNTYFFVEASSNNSYVVGNNTNGRAGIGRTPTFTFTTEDFGHISYPTQLGSIGRLYSSPVQIGTSSWSQVSATMRRTMAISSDGLLYGWGLNKYGEIGDNVGPTTIIARSSPVQIGTSSWLSVSAGAHHTLAITADNKLFTWGYNAFGQLGSGTALSRSSPVQVGTSSWSFISASSSDSGITNDYFSGAIRSDSVLFMWGANDQGFLGDGTETDRSSPVQIGGAPARTVYSPVQLAANSGWTKVSTGSGETTFANVGHSFATKRFQL